MVDIVILTDSANKPQFNEHNQLQNAYIEDSLLQNALEAEGLTTLRLAWDDPDFDWATTKAAIFRSTWDYFYRFSEFEAWLKHASTKTKLINSRNTIYWNIDKHYLLDLKAKGVHIAESHFIEKGTNTTLKQLHNTLGWKETVLKPCISGTARHTYKLNTNNIEKYESVFKQLIATEAMMLQPFQYDIVNKGEVSMMLFGGQYTHAVLKKAKQGDFRVQDDFGGSVIDYQPTLNEIAFAEYAVRACPELPLYARVDVFNDNQGHIALSELELIEPELWFRLHPSAATQLAQEVAIQIDHL